MKSHGPSIVIILLQSLPSRGAWIEIESSIKVTFTSESLPSRGAWIEIHCIFCAYTRHRSLPSRGAWIEICPGGRSWGRNQSLPSRGAWIEISCICFFRRMGSGRSPHGERGLKFPIALCTRLRHPGRSPHGERGLKLFASISHHHLEKVAPLTGSVD